MHELSIAQGVVEICEQNAAGRRVTLVCLEIGALSGVVPEALEFCFDSCTQGSLLEGAALQIERVSATGYCDNCCQLFPIEVYFDPCPACGAFRLEVRSGEEMRVKYLEVE